MCFRTPLKYQNFAFIALALFENYIQVILSGHTELVGKRTLLKYGISKQIQKINKKI
jgi:hypothetical protein